MAVTSNVLALMLVWPSRAVSANTTDGLWSKNTEACIDAYYGIDQAVDYSRAYKCFKANQIYQFLIPMQLNGQGVPASIKKARKLMDAWLKGNPEFAQSLEATAMAKLIADRASAEHKPAPEVDYCRDVAATTYSVGFCAWIHGRLQNQNFEKALAPIRAKLTSQEKIFWDRMLNAFGSYLDAEGNRGAQMYAGGSASGSAYTFQQIYVRQNFLELMQNAFGNMNLVPSSKDELAKAESAMQEAYNNDIASYEETYPPDAGSCAASAAHDAFSQTECTYVAEYKHDLQVSQSKWLVLRDLCAKLAALAYKNKRPDVDWTTSLDTAMTFIRIGEIKNRPLGS